MLGCLKSFTDMDGFASQVTLYDAILNTRYPPDRVEYRYLSNIS